MPTENSICVSSLGTSVGPRLDQDLPWGVGTGERTAGFRSPHLLRMHRSNMDQKCLPSWRNPARYPTSPDADAFVHASHLMGGVHQRGGRRAAHRAAHRGAVGPERSGRSILKLTSLCRCAGPQEAAFCVLRAMRHRGCYGIGGRVFEHRVEIGSAPPHCQMSVY